MKNKPDELLGKEIYGCQFLGTRLNLNPTTFSLCHEAQVGDRILGQIEDLSPEAYYEALYQLVKTNENEDAPCRRCSKGKAYKYQFKPITFVTVNTSGYCNSSCIYCTSHFGKEGEGYNPNPYLEMFEKEHLFAPNCYFDWGGGEPTLNPHFEECVEWLFQHGYFQRINTNAIIYSEATAMALEKGKACLRMSLDSGTKKCFEHMKGHEDYLEVWNNVKRYCDKNRDQVYVKYNVCNYNSNRVELEIFLMKCRECGVKNILIDAEIRSYQPLKNAGPFYFTKKEFEAAHILEEMAKEQGFHVGISAYAFSVRAEYDEDGKLCLPTKYYDNIDREILSNNIGVKTFPNIEYMIKDLKESKVPVAIWGMGVYGKMCFEILQKEDVLVTYLIDKSSDKQEEGWRDKPIISPEKFFEMQIPAKVILTGNREVAWKGMLQFANDKKYDMGELIYLNNIFYRNYGK